MTRLYTNNYSTVLSAAITNVATTMTVESVAALPAIGAGETCQLTIDDGASIEIVTATAVAGSVITITRAQEGTTGTAFGLGTPVELRPTAISFIDPAGVIDFGAATSLEIPNGAAPTVDAAGEIAVDTTVTDHTGMVKFHDGTEELSIPGIPTANITTTDGHIIAYNAANNEFEMVAPAGGGGGDWVKISTQTASASAQIDFTGLSTTYRDFVVVFSHVIPATDNNNLYMRTSTDNGSTYDSGATDYRYVTDGQSMNGGAHVVFNSTGASFIRLAASLGGAANESLSGWVKLHDPQTAAFAHVTFEGLYLDTTGVGKRGVAAGTRESAGDVDAIRFYMAAGNITSGEFTLYGITK